VVDAKGCCRLIVAGISAEENSVYRCVELADNLFRTSDVEAVIIASVDLAGSMENICLRQHFGRAAQSPKPQQDVLATEQWFVGEGAAAIVVKPQSQVAAEQVYATIDGVAFATGCQAESIGKAASSALQIANKNAQNVTSIEAHASGFAKENHAEKIALAKLYPNTTVSSVKSNIGHTFNASGIASIIKTALLLDHNAGATQICGFGNHGAEWSWPR